MQSSAGTSRKVCVVCKDIQDWRRPRQASGLAWLAGWPRTAMPCHGWSSSAASSTISRADHRPRRPATPTGMVHPGVHESPAPPTLGKPIWSWSTAHLRFTPCRPCPLWIPLLPFQLPSRPPVAPNEGGNGAATLLFPPPPSTSLTPRRRGGHLYRAAGRGCVPRPALPGREQVLPDARQKISQCAARRASLRKM